ncbi:MAG: NYN domain-containing protein [Clostridiales bacterium]|nr:NYN domain-containing protein [Clostridiales bacterium]MDR2752322.1 NYN domain-containing protein [Clostridiales bacterium]
MTRSQEFLFVDGYNVIFAWKHLKKLADSSLEDARIKLLDILCDYQGFVQNTVICVFDAHHANGSGEPEKHCNIFVVYTRNSETADNYIERAAATLSKKVFVRVVTSDYLEQIIVIGHGAIRVSAAEFEREIETIKAEKLPQYTSEASAKKSPLIDRVDKRTAELLERMRRNLD